MLYWESVPNLVLTPRTQSGPTTETHPDRFWPTEETFLNAFNCSAVAMGLAGMDGRWLKTNQALQALFGYSEEEFLKRTFRDLTHPDDLAASVERVRQLKDREANSFQIEKRYVHRDGHIIWALLNLAIVRDADGEGSYLIGQIQDISERKRAEDELIWRTAFFEAKVNSSPDGILVVDSGLKIIVENHRMHELWRMPPHIVASPDAAVRIPWMAEATKDPESFLKRMSHLFAHPLEVSHDIIDLKDGRTLEQDTSPVCGKDGILYGRIWWFRDITEKTRTRERLDRFFSMSPDMVFIAGYDGYYRETNPAATKIMGFSPQELMETPFVNFVVEEDRAGVEQAVRQTVETGHISDFGTRFCCKDGSIKWLEVNAVAVPDEQLLYATARDVTERKLAEEELERLRREHDKVLSAVGDGVHWIGLNGKIKFENPAAAKMLGYKMEELIGQQAHAVMHHSRADGTAFPVAECSIHATLRDGEVRRVNNEVFWRKDGTSFAVEYTCTPTHDDVGNANGCVVTFTDVTERKRFEADIQNARVAAETASRSKTEFLANMSHEIRTPLNGIIGMTDLMNGTPLTAEQKDFLETIHASGENLLTIVNDVLDFSKIEFGKLELDFHAFNVLDLLDDVVGMFNFRMTKKKLEFVTSMQDELPVDYLGDATRIRQVLINLVANAIKFTERGQVSLEVCAGAPMEDGEIRRVLFRIRDTGIGIPEDRIDRLFKIFSQVDASTTRRFGGSGLGLAICHKLVEIMGGTIRVESEPDRGSVFSFELPLALAHQERAEVKVESELAGRRVLIVDDIETNRRMLTLQLSRWGMTWVDVPTGEEGLLLLEKGEQFDAALIDFQMPNMDGIMVARQIGRTLKAHPLPLILISSQTGDISITELNQAGFSAVLAKPLRQNLLRSTLQQVFRNPTGAISPPPPTEVVIFVPLNILVVEDNLTNQKVARQILRRLGYETDMVSNGKEALVEVRKKTYDLILMDIHMPELDGLEATREIRKISSPTVPPMIIALTADVLKGEREVCLAVGMDDYLTKPVKIENLKAVIEKVKERKSPGAAGN
jgi:PAS domain S-box-containing protein